MFEYFALSFETSGMEEGSERIIIPALLELYFLGDLCNDLSLDVADFFAEKAIYATIS